MSKRIFTEDESAGFVGFENQLPRNTDVAAKMRRMPGAAKDQLREDIFREAFQAGYQAGFAQGHLASVEDNRRNAERFRRDLESVVQRCESAMELWFQKAEHGLSSLASEIAKKIIATELATQPDAILGIVREALGRVTNSTHARIRLNPFDLAMVSENKEYVLQACQFVSDVEIVGDESLTPGSTVVESDSGVIDCRIEAKLDAINSNEAA